MTTNYNIVLRTVLLLKEKVKNLKIKKKSTLFKVDKNANTLRTNVPSLVREVMSLKVGDTLIWVIENENEIKIRKEWIKSLPHDFYSFSGHNTKNSIFCNVITIFINYITYILRTIFFTRVPTKEDNYA